MTQKRKMLDDAFERATKIDEVWSYGRMHDVDDIQSITREMEACADPGKDLEKRRGFNTPRDKLIVAIWEEYFAALQPTG